MNKKLKKYIKQNVRTNISAAKLRYWRSLVECYAVSFNK